MLAARSQSAAELVRRCRALRRCVPREWRCLGRLRPNVIGRLSGATGYLRSRPEAVPREQLRAGVRCPASHRPLVLRPARRPVAARHCRSLAWTVSSHRMGASTGSKARGNGLPLIRLARREQSNCACTPFDIKWRPHFPAHSTLHRPAHRATRRADWTMGVLSIHRLETQG